VRVNFQHEWVGTLVVLLVCHPFIMVRVNFQHEWVGTLVVLLVCHPFIMVRKLMGDAVTL